MNTETYQHKNYELELQREIRLTQEQRERNEQCKYQRLFWAVTAGAVVVGLIYEVAGRGFL